MVSARNEQATAATSRDWYQTDPRAYIRIAAVLRERITAGDLAPGQAAPSITRLGADHGVARQTAAHALHVLQDAGLISTPGPRTRLPRLQRHPFPAALFPSRATSKTAPAKAIRGRVGGTSLPCLTARQLSTRSSLVL